MSETLRVLVALAIIVLLVRAARQAWRNRTLAYAVWRRIRPRHVLGSLALLAAVLTTALALLTFVPVTRYGLGSLIGLTGNAVFAPLEEATARAGTAGGPGVRWWLVAGTTGFLGVLLALLPWLAYVEERVFREGLESAGPRRELWTALRFGIAHLVMLIPVAAALAIGVAGYAYGRLYRAAYARAIVTGEEHTGGFAGPATVVARQQARDRAVLTATVWHTTFNSLIVLLVLAGVLATLR